MKTGIAGALAAAVAVAVGAGTPSGVAAQHRSGDIVEVAAQAGSFQTLLAAAQAAGLVETLKGEGPFTVFAPTDAAFDKLPEGTVESLLQNPAQLAEILEYHVVPGRIMAADVVKAGQASPRTVQGQQLDVRTVDGAVMVDNARVVQADVHASNGVIHVIDSVILPSSDSGMQR